MGWYIWKSLEKNQIETTYFCDQRASDDFSHYHGIKVISQPELLKEEWAKDAKILVAIFNSTSRETVSQNLKKQGFNVIEHDPYSYIHHYFTNIINRNVSSLEFAQTIEKLREYYDCQGYQYGEVKENLFVSPYTTGNITTKCNLKCMDCSQYIPLYESPQNYTPNQIYDDIAAFCECFDLVPEISLQGGESLLNQDIGEICLKLSQIPNLVFINVYTNGTLLPSPENWEKLKKAGADFHQSDYQSLSKKQEAIFNLAAQNDLYCDINFVFDDTKWHRTEIKDFKRSLEQDDQVYKKCISTKICAHILEGDLYRCSLAAHGGKQNLVPLQKDTDFVPLRLKDGSPNIEGVREYLKKDTALGVCKYCDPDEFVVVPPAIQLSGKNKRIIEETGQKPLA
ncbi:radical SAM protein [Terasakiella sp. SH-1]|uniref:radical SAM protein n=1 Tax=Terasakiella sp. SH-1 TaxID=2560057 RepID=UPI0014310FC9|nr:radical SAM protein [Terasakiella sp. SH-1]